jgi:hypothetical protein
MSNTESSFLHLIANEVKIYSNMFHPGVEDMIGAQLSGSDIVTVNDWTGRQWETKIT